MKKTLMMAALTAVLLTGCSGTAAANVAAAPSTIPTPSATPTSSATPTLACPTPMPTVTVTVTATPTPSGAPDEPSAEGTPTLPAEDSAAAACPTSSTTVLAALYADGDSCTTVGERYTLAGANLSCTKDRNGATVWMEKTKADKLASDLAREKAATTNSGSGTDTQTTDVVPSVAQVVGTIICKDGYVWPGTVRRGACHGHQGIAN